MALRIELSGAHRPRLVITDSQSFLKVAADTPSAVPLTSFSILFARLKGDLVAQVEGALAIEQLRPGDRVLIAEACAHHPIGEDIRPREDSALAQQYVGGRLDFPNGAGTRLSVGSVALSAHRSLRLVHAQSARSPEPHLARPGGRCALYQLRTVYRLQPGNLRARPGAISGGAGCAFSS